MKYLKNYNIFEGKAEDKALKRIQKFFGLDSISKKAIEISPKLSVWIIRSFMKILEKHFDKDLKEKIKSGDIDQTQYESMYSDWMDLSPKFQYIFDWVNSFDITIEQKKNFTKMSFDEAYKASDEWHKSLNAGGKIEDEHGEIIMKFPDGFYWIDLETTKDRDEADAMGHCGYTGKGTTLYSLRDRNKSPHVTAAIDQDNGIVYQMKGRNNFKPISKYHLYIVGLLGNDDLEYKINGFGAEYDKDNDFSPEEDLDRELLDELKETRPNIDRPVHTPEQINDMFSDMMESYYMQEDQYGFRLVEWLFDLKDLDTVINNIHDGKVLFEILCEEFPEKMEIDERFKTDIEEELKTSKLMVNIAARHIDAKTIAEKYNLDIPKGIPSKMWDEIYKYIGYDALVDELKDNVVWDRYEKELDEEYPLNEEFIDNFIFSRYSFGKTHITYDIKYMLEFFFGTNKKKTLMKGLCDLFDGSGHIDTWNKSAKEKAEIEKNKNYYEDIKEVFDLNGLSGDICYYMKDGDMEKELLDNEWYAYIGDY